MQTDNPLSPLKFTSHVAVLFLLIAVVLAATLLSGLQTFVMPCIWPLVLIALLVPLGNLLNWTDDVRAKLRTRTAHALQPLVSRLCDELKIHPRTLIEETDEAASLHTVGGARRSLIVASTTIVDRLAAAYLEPDSDKRTFVEALIFHELQHVAQKDVRWLFWARSLLSTVAWSTGWVCMLAFGLLITLQVLGTPFLEHLSQPGTMEILATNSGLPKETLEMAFPRDKLLATLNEARGVQYGWLYLGVIYTLLPLAAACGVLSAVVWVRMMRVREFYADAAVAERYGSDAALGALNFLQAISTFATASPRGKKSDLRLNLRALNPKRFTLFWPDYHPSRQERRSALRNLTDVLTQPVPNGLIIGSVAFLLSLLGSGAASILLFGAQPVLLPLLVIFVSSSTLMTPAIAALPGPKALQRVLACVTIALAIGMFYVLLNVALALFLAGFLPNDLLTAADLIVRIVYGVSAPVATPDDAGRLWQTAWATLLSMVIGVGLVVAAAYADFRVKRLLLRAKSPSLQQPHVSRLALLSTLAVGAGLAIALIALTRLVQTIQVLLV